MSSPNDREKGLDVALGSGLPIEWVRRLLESDDRTDEVIQLIDNLENAVRIRHESITPSEYGSRAPGSQPDPVPVGTVFTLVFTPGDDSAYRVFKIPAFYVSDASFHIHWTKSEDVNEVDRAVKWKLSYTVFDGGPALGGVGGDIVQTPTVVEFEDVYTDSDATGTRLIHRTPNIPAPGFIPNYYVGVCVEAVAPAGTALVNEPALVSMDLIWVERINI